MSRSEDPHAQAHRHLIEHDLKGRGIDDGRVLAAMAKVRRESFVDPELAHVAYADHPLPIGSNQTISQPFIVAAMAQAAELQPTDRVLEVGTGSGYGAAVLACLGAEIFTVERLPALAEVAAQRLADVDGAQVEVQVGDGSLGLPEQAPYDAIVVTAGGPAIPHALRRQLADGGRLIIPVGSHHRHQSLVRVRRQGDDFTTERLGRVHFVPLIGAQAWEPPPPATAEEPPGDEPGTESGGEAGPDGDHDEGRGHGTGADR
jgi:protein-L-isoaspartate(D-aspartate) O-methyltransferase